MVTTLLLSMGHRYFHERKFTSIFSSQPTVGLRLLNDQMFLAELDNENYPFFMDAVHGINLHEILQPPETHYYARKSGGNEGLLT